MKGLASMTHGMPASLKWAVVALAGVWLAWRIVALNLANLALVEGGNPEAALGFYGDHPRAHMEIGQRELDTRPQDAMAHLRAAVGGNPTEARNFAALGQLLDRGGADDLARKAMETADRMAPQRSDVQMAVTAYWMAKGDFPRGLRHWDTVLRHQPDLRTRLFPYLLKVAEDSANQPAFEALLAQPVPWWTAFFNYAAVHSPDPNTVRRLFSLSRRGANPLPRESVGAYISRLQKEGEWTEAWFAWLSSLSKEQLAQTGYVYNGSFELRPTDIGFDWLFQKTPAVAMDVAATYGTTGERALNLVFKGLRIRFEHLSQYLMLPKGAYYLQGRARPDNLKAAQGMQWALYCLGSREPLTVSERFTGADNWTRFRSQFTVPAGCPVQLLRLELAGRIDLDFDVSGSIWFDDLAIERVGQNGF